MPLSKVRQPTVADSIPNTAPTPSLPFTVIPIPIPPATPPRRHPLSRKQRNVLVWITAYKIIHGYTPTSLEIREGMRIKSSNEMLVMLQVLAKKGWIKMVYAKSGRRLARSIEILGDDVGVKMRATDGKAKTRQT